MASTSYELGMSGARETDLYGPVKGFLEGQGFVVKGEVADADVVACRGDDPPVIVELKLRFSLSLFHQAVTRLKVTDLVYLAVPRPTGRSARATSTSERHAPSPGTLTRRAARPAPTSYRHTARRCGRRTVDHRRDHGEVIDGGFFDCTDRLDEVRRWVVDTTG